MSRVKFLVPTRTAGFIANMVLYPDAGKGAVVISNSEAGRWLNRELIAAIATEYDWPGYPVRRRAGTVTAEQMRELSGTYGVEGFSDATFSVRVEGSRLLGKLSGGQPFEMTPTTDEGLFVLPSESLEMLFHRASDGTIEKVTVRRAGESGNVYDRLDV